MTISISANVPAPVRSLLYTVLQALGPDAANAVIDDDAKFKLTLQSLGGKAVHASLQKGGGPFQVEGVIKAGALVVPEGGAAEGDVSFGSTTLVTSYKDITVTALPEGGDPIPEGAVIYAIASTRAGVAKALRVERVSASVFRIHSEGNGFSGPLVADTASGALTSGTADYAMVGAVTAGDLFWVEEISTGGDPADHFSAFRKDADEITVQAHDAAGALVATNTSTVRVHNLFGARPLASVIGDLAAGLGTFALTNAAGDRLLVEEVEAAGTAANHFVAVRVDNSNVKVFAVQADGSLQTANTSTVRVYNAGPVDCANAILSSGTLDVLMTVAAADQLSVDELATGGDPATTYSAVRKDADEVTVNAHDASGDQLATNTSTVRVFNHGQPGHETSVVAWLVRRP